MYIKSDGTVWGNGSNGFGQAGNYDPNHSNLNSKKVPTLVSGISNVKDISRW